MLPLTLMLIFAFSVTASKSVTGQSKNSKQKEVKQEIKKKPHLVKVSEKEKDKNQEEVFMVVENPPKYPGGEPARQEFFAENMKYPKKAKEQGIQGKVYITFVVEPNGSVTNIQVLRGIGGGCDEEAIRVIRLMPNWEPGTQRGQAVRVQVNMPIKFSLPKKKEQTIEK